MATPGTGRSRQTNGMTLKVIFNQCQEKKQAHNRLLEHTKKLFQSTSHGTFTNEFKRYLLLAFQTPEPNPFANNMIEFASKFAICVYSEETLENKENKMNSTANTDLEDSSETNDNPFLTNLVKFLVELCAVTDLSTRLHACRMLKLLLTDMSTDSSIEDDLFEAIQEALLACLKDKQASVRTEAARALFRLQDPSNKDCPVIKQYLLHMKMDPNPVVREAILNCIGPTTVTLDSVIDRTRDEKDRVRKRAYQFLSEKVHIKALSISKRVRILKEGLQDRVDTVKEFVANSLVPAWLNMCNENILTFLRCLDVGVQETEESMNIYKLALDSVIENITFETAVKDFIKTLSEEKVIPSANLTCENSFYWMYLISYVQKKDAEDGERFLELMQPELICFCQYIKKYILTVDNSWDLNDKLDHQFISEQLLHIASIYDLADIAGSQSLNAVVNDIFLSNNCPASLVKPLIACIIKTKLDPEERLHMVAELISNIKEPVLVMEFEVSEEERNQIKLKIAKIKVELNELNENLKTFASNEEFVKALETKEKITQFEMEKEKLRKGLLPSTKEVRTEKNDSDTLLKCMTMITELMTQAPFKKMTPTLHTLMDTLLIPGLHNPDPAVRKQGVLAVGLCSIINASIATTYFVVFLQISQMDVPSIHLMALKAIYDLLHIHGVEMFQSAETPEPVEDGNEKTELFIPETPPHGEGRTKTVSNLLTILKSHLDSKYDDIRAVSAQGLGKLLLLGHIYSSELLSHLILLWFNPTTDTNSLLLHFLGVFIPTYAAHGRNSKQCFEEAFISTLTTVLEAPNSSPLSRVNPIHMAKVILELVQPISNGDDVTNRGTNELDVQESKAHDRIAEKICVEILKDTDNSISNQKWSQILLTLYLSSTCLPVHKNINTLLGKMKTRVRDRSTLKHLANFTKILDAILMSETTLNENESQSSQAEIGSVTSNSINGTIVGSTENKASSDLDSSPTRKQLRRNRNLNLSVSSDSVQDEHLSQGKNIDPLKTPDRRKEDNGSPNPYNVRLTRSQKKALENSPKVLLVKLRSSSRAINDNLPTGTKSSLCSFKNKPNANLKNLNKKDSSTSTILKDKSIEPKKDSIRQNRSSESEASKNSPKTNERRVFTTSPNQSIQRFSYSNINTRSKDRVLRSSSLQTLSPRSSYANRVRPQSAAASPNRRKRIYSNQARLQKSSTPKEGQKPSTKTCARQSSNTDAIKQIQSRKSNNLSLRGSPISATSTGLKQKNLSLTENISGIESESDSVFLSPKSSKNKAAALSSRSKLRVQNSTAENSSEEESFIIRRLRQCSNSNQSRDGKEIQHVNELITSSKRQSSLSNQHRSREIPIASLEKNSDNDNQDSSLRESRSQKKSTKTQKSSVTKESNSSRDINIRKGKSVLNVSIDIFDSENSTEFKGNDQRNTVSSNNTSPKRSLRSSFREEAKKKQQRVSLSFLMSETESDYNRSQSSSMKPSQETGDVRPKTKDPKSLRTRRTKTNNTNRSLSLSTISTDVSISRKVAQSKNKKARKSLDSSLKLQLSSSDETGDYFSTSQRVTRLQSKNNSVLTRSQTQH